MMAYRLVAWERPPEPVEVEVPRPRAGELLVRVAGNGLCHSDITMGQIPAAIGAELGWQMPFTLGHEIGGWVDGDLSGANMKDANLARANLSGANLKGANMIGANLTDAKLAGAELKGANVKDVVWSNTICPDGTNSDANGDTCVGHL